MTDYRSIFGMWESNLKNTLGLGEDPPRWQSASSDRHLGLVRNSRGWLALGSKPHLSVLPTPHPPSSTALSVLIRSQEKQQQPQPCPWAGSVHTSPHCLTSQPHLTASPHIQKGSIKSQRDNNRWTHCKVTRQEFTGMSSCTPGD